MSHRDTYYAIYLDGEYIMSVLGWTDAVESAGELRLMHPGAKVTVEKDVTL